MSNTHFRAMSIDVHGNLTTHDWPPALGLLNWLQDTVHGNIAAVRLSDHLTMWVNEEGVYRCEPNPVATYVAAQFGFDHQPYFGTAVFTGGADPTGNTLPLGRLVEMGITAHAMRSKATRTPPAAPAAQATPTVAAKAQAAETLTTLSTRARAALDAEVAAASRLLALAVREQYPAALTVHLSPSDQGDWFEAVAWSGQTGERTQLDDEFDDEGAAGHLYPAQIVAMPWCSAYNRRSGEMTLDISSIL